MSGLRTLGFLLFAPFVIGAFIIGIFGFGTYNMLIIPAILVGEAILVLAEIITLEEKEIKVELKNGSDNSNKNE